MLVERRCVRREGYRDSEAMPAAPRQPRDVGSRDDQMLKIGLRLRR